MGYADDLRDTISVVRAQGTGFMKSLEVTPAPVEDGIEPSQDLWAWVNGRLEELALAEDALAEIVALAEQVMRERKERNDPKKPAGDPSRRGATFSAFNVATNVLQGYMVPPAPRIHGKASRRSLTNANIFDDCNESDVIMDIVRAEARLGDTHNIVKAKLLELQDSVGLSGGRVWQSAVDIMKALSKAQEESFEEFAKFHSRTFKDIRQALVGELDRGGAVVVQVPKLFMAVLESQRVVGAQALIGDKALAAARSAGVGLPEDEVQPPNPFGPRATAPLWEAVFLEAVEKLSKAGKQTLESLQYSLQSGSVTPGRLSGVSSADLGSLHLFSTS